MHNPTDRIPQPLLQTVVEHWLEREIAQWVHPMKDRSDNALTNELHLAPSFRESPTELDLETIVVSVV